MAGLANKGLDQMVLPAVVAPGPIGLYAVASNLSGMLLILVGSLSMVLLPEVSRRTPAEAIALSFRAARIALLVSAVIALAIGLASPLFLRIAYGAAFVPAVLPLRILLVGSVLLVGAAMLIAGLQGICEPGEATRVSLVGLAVTLVGLALTLKPYGIIGAAYTSLASYTATFLMAWWRLSSKAPSCEPLLSPRAFLTDMRAIRALMLSRARGRTIARATR